MCAESIIFIAIKWSETWQNFRGETSTSQKVQVLFYFIWIRKKPTHDKGRQGKAWKHEQTSYVYPQWLGQDVLPTCLFLIGYNKHIITRNWWPYHGLTTSSTNGHVSPVLWLGRLDGYYNLWQGSLHLLPSLEQFVKKKTVEILGKYQCRDPGPFHRAVSLQPPWLFHPGLACLHWHNLPSPDAFWTAQPFKVSEFSETKQCYIILRSSYQFLFHYRSSPSSLPDSKCLTWMLWYHVNIPPKSH